MTGRVSVFSDQRIIDFIADNFIPVTTDINKSMFRKDSDGDYFRKIAEQGHYAGRTRPTNTRQGLYVALADGKMLASVNSTHANDVLKMMRLAMARLKLQNSRTDKMDSEKFKADRRYSQPFPEGGMSLKVTSRDLPRKAKPDYPTWRHNFDYLWLTADEVSAFAPKEFEAGHVYKIPEKVINRITRFHLLDNVKGETPFWPKEAVKTASAVAKVVDVQGSKVQIELRGRVHCVDVPSGTANPYSGKKINSEYGVKLKLSARLTWDTKAKAFTHFDWVAYGDRWGTTLFNFRFKDLGKNSIGFSFQMLPHVPGRMAEPKFLQAGYFESY